MTRLTAMSAEKKPIDRHGAAVDLLRLERIELGLARDIDALRDRYMTFPSPLTQKQLDKLVAEHESVAALTAELRSILQPEPSLLH